MTVTRLDTLPLANGEDVVIARRRARRLAQALGFERLDQLRVAAAASELVRGALRQAPPRKLVFSFDGESRELLLGLQLASGEGSDAGLDSLTEEVVAARRVMDRFDVDNETRNLLLSKRLPKHAETPTPKRLEEIRQSLNRQTQQDIYREFEKQNAELLQALAELRQQQIELKQVNEELEETNRGVVALYAELEENAESLRRASEEKSRFYSGISHELRTPINSVLALAKMLLDRLDGELTSEQEKQVTLIQTAAENLREWVNDLLDLAKVDAGRMELHPDHFTLADLYAGLRGMMRPLQTTPEVQLRFESCEEPVTFFNDETKITHILRNLISNALKYTEQGEVVVTTALLPDSDRVRIAVRDTGVGIAAADQERIFDEFVQVAGPLQKLTKGTGLGLPLSRRLAALLQGEITVNSALGKGSTFSFEFPRQVAVDETDAEARAPSPAPEPQLTGQSDAQQVEILIIDDEESARYVLKKELIAIAPQLETVIYESNRGREGLALAAKLKPKLIFLDLDMPDMSGYDVLDRLTHSTSGSEADIVVHSSHAPELVDVVELTSRTLGILPKPLPSGSAGYQLLHGFLTSCGLPVTSTR